jgi:hypothetical protein
MLLLELPVILEGVNHISIMRVTENVHVEYRYNLTNTTLHCTEIRAGSVTRGADKSLAL